MEIEEAINELKDLKDYCSNTFMIRTYEAYAQAINKGIEALENQQKENGHWNDSCPIVSDGSLWKSWVCSKCDNRVMVKTPYCCRCGAKMEG